MSKVSSPTSGVARRMLRPLDAARRVGVHPDTLARWCDEAVAGPLARAVMRLPSGHRRYEADAIALFVRLTKKRGACR